MFHLLSILSACDGQPQSLETGIPLQPYVAAKNELMPAAYDNSAWQTDTLFISNSVTAGRVSIIDAGNETEVRSWHKEDAIVVLPLPGFQGAVFVTQDTLAVKAQGFEKTFALEKPYRHIARASRNVAFSFASRDGTSVEIIRYLGNDQWQHATVAMPWHDDESALAEPPAVISQFSDNERYLAVLNTTNGLFAVFWLPPEIDVPIEPISDWCRPDSLGSTMGPAYYSFNWDWWEWTTFGVGFIGDSDGRLSAFTIESVYDSVCGETVPLESRNLSINNPTLVNFHLPEIAPVTHIARYKVPQPEVPGPWTYRLGIIQDPIDGSASLHVVNYAYDVGAFTEEFRVDNLCESALGSMMLQKDFILVTCAAEATTSYPASSTGDNATFNANSAQNNWISNGHIDPQVYVLIDATSGEILQRYSLRESGVGNALSSGYTIDSNRLILYRMTEGAFGDLVISNLLTGETRVVRGLFLKNVIEK